MDVNKPQYAADKPKQCENCYFWLGMRRGCELKKCHYLIEKKKEPPVVEDITGNCRYCPYGKHSPCIGYCLQKILRELKLR